MIARGEIDPAIALLNQLRAQQPDNADAPYLLAMIDFDNRRWPDGLAAAQIAVRKNPALKADPDLIKGAIRSLVSDRGYDRSQAFLRSLGQPATPFIKEAAARDPSPKVRERAAELLGSSGRGWGSRPSSSAAPCSAAEARVVRSSGSRSRAPESVDVFASAGVDSAQPCRKQLQVRDLKKVTSLALLAPDILTPCPSLGPLPRRSWWRR